MVVQISEDIIKKAQEELFNGSALRDLSMCLGFDKNNQVDGVYSWNTMYQRVTEYMKSNGTLDKYTKWVNLGKKGGKLNLELEESDDDEEEEIEQNRNNMNSTLNTSLLVLSSPIYNSLNHSNISSQYQDCILKLTADKDSLLKERGELKQLVSQQSTELSLTNAVILNQQEVINSHTSRIKSEINSHTTTRNRLNVTLNDLSTSEKRVAELELESANKRRKIEQEQEATDAFFRNLNGNKI